MHCYTLRLGSGSKTVSMESIELAIYSACKAAAIKAVGEPPSNQSFRFMDLPVELQIHILKYTDLISPSKQFERDHSGRFIVIWACHVSARNQGTRGDQFEKSKNCEGSCTWRDCYMQNQTALACFCSQKHMVYSTKASNLSKCWSPPTPLFLISREFSQKAQWVFKTSNTFS